MKIYTLIGGVNGAGKSSLTGSLRAERSDLGQIVDPDALTARCGGDEYEKPGIISACTMWALTQQKKASAASKTA